MRIQVVVATCLLVIGRLPLNVALVRGAGKIVVARDTSSEPTLMSKSVHHASESVRKSLADPFIFGFEGSDDHPLIHKPGGPFLFDYADVLSQEYIWQAGNDTLEKLDTFTRRGDDVSLLIMGDSTVMGVNAALRYLLGTRVDDDLPPALQSRLDEAVSIVDRSGCPHMPNIHAYVLLPPVNLTVYMVGTLGEGAGDRGCF